MNAVREVPVDRVSAAPRVYGTFWPEPDEELLLIAAVGPAGRAVDAWKRLRPGLDIETMPEEGMTLLPLVYRNLTLAGVEDPDLPRLKGIYRHTWARNQYLLGSLARVIDDLNQRGVRTIALKGIALLLLYYPDAATRPMADVDILVRPRDVATALDALGAPRALEEESGADRIPRFLHGVEVRTPSGTRVDLHWRLSDYGADDRTLEEIWTRARPVEIGTTRTLALEPEQLFVHICTHGMSAVSSRTLRWIADCVMVVEAGSVSFDWNRLVKLSSEQGCSLPVRDALAYLGGTFDVRVPREVVRDLDGVPRSRREELGYSATSRAPHGREPLRTARTVAAHYTRITARMPLGHAIGAFPTYLRESWRVPRKRDLPKALATRVWKRVTRT